MLAVVFSIAWLAGIAGIAAWSSPVWLPGAVFAFVTPVAARLGGRTYALAAIVAAVLALAGAARFDSWASQPAPGLLEYAGQEVDVHGTIDGLADPGLTVQQFRLDANSVTTTGGSRSVEGAVLLTVDQQDSLEPGARVTASGTLELAPVFDGFDYRSFLLRRGVAGTMYSPAIEVTGEPSPWAAGAAVERMRAGLESALVAALPEPEASLATGITIGRDGGIPQDLYEDFRRSGLAHVLAVSGSNIVVITALAFWGLSPFAGRRIAIWPAMAMTAGYVVLAGAEASILRAGLMAGIFLFGEYLGRQQSGLAALGLTGVILTAWSPGIAMDVGFQLSFAATAGLMVFTPWVRYGMERGLDRLGLLVLVPRGVSMVVALSVATTVTTVPLLWINFGAVSIIGPVANVAAEVLFLGVLATGLVCGFAGIMSPELGWLTGLVAYYPAAGLRWTAEFFGGLPFASMEVPRANATWAAAAYCLLAVPGWFAYRHLAPQVDRRPARGAAMHAKRLALAGAVSGTATIVVFHSLAPLRADNDLRMVMLDVGQGDAMLLETPGGSQVLVDGGPSGLTLMQQLASEMPHWDRRLDAVVVSHPHQDHIAGLGMAVDRYDIEHAYDAGFDRDLPAAQAYAAADFTRQTLAAGDTFELDGVAFEVLWPRKGYYVENWNNMSLVLRVTYGEFSMLLTGDIEEAPQRTLMETADLRSTALKVPHQGSASSDAAFFDAVGAEVALLPVGSDNRYGHPAGTTLAQLAGATLVRTDIHGRVEVRTDGDTFDVSVEHPTR